MRTIKFTITEPPPSLNSSKKWRQGAMRSTKEYLDWQRIAGLELMTQRGKLPDPCYWRSEILIPASKTKADLDNLLKALHDLLVKNGRVPDDRYKVAVRAQFWKGDHVVIAVTQEEVSQWATIKNASKSLLKRLAMSSR